MPFPEEIKKKSENNEKTMILTLSLSAPTHLACCSSIILFFLCGAVQKSGMGMMGLGVGGAGKYVPPSRKGFPGRGEAGPAGSGTPMAMGEDHTKIRVTNISEDTTEGDLRDLFSAFGRINRLVLLRVLRVCQCVCARVCFRYVLCVSTRIKKQKLQVCDDPPV